MNNIIWKGVSSTTIQGLLISELPPITKPEMRIKQTEIDGMDGSIIEELGYASYVKTVTIGLYGNFDINKIVKYFTGEGDIVFSNEPDKVYKAKICGKIDYTRLLRYRQASIPFLVQPFKYKLNEYLRETQTEAVSGTSIVVNDHEDDILKSFKIYGKSTQDGTPTPSAPIDIVSLCEDGSIAVTVNGEAFDLAVTSKLKGIPVTDKSLATYTDASGQMWCADEIDLEKGVYVQRIAHNTVSVVSEQANESDLIMTVYMPTVNWNTLNQLGLLTSIATPSESTGSYSNTTPNLCRFNATGTTIMFDISRKEYPTLADFNAYLVDNPVEVAYIRATPIVTELTEEEITAYKALKLNEPTTIITNNDGASMTVEYFKPFEVFNEGLENSKPLMVLKGSGTVEISVNGIPAFTYTFPDGENEVYIDSEKEDAYLGDVLKNRNMNGEFPTLIPKTNKIEWSGNIVSISILIRSRWL